MDTLIRTLADRDIDLGYDDVGWAFESGPTKNAMLRYVDEYLSPTTLLSREELSTQVSHRIQRCIVLLTVQRYRVCSRKQGLEIAGPKYLALPQLIDVDFEDPLAALKRSTRAIEQSTVNLEAQKTAYLTLQTQARSVNHREHVPNPSTSGKDLGSTSTIDRLQVQLSDAKRRASNTLHEAESMVDKALDADDMALDSFQKLRVDVSGKNGSEDLAQEVDRLCTSLAALRGKELRHKINEVYKASLSDGVNNQLNGHDEPRVEDNEQQTLTTELDTLIGEVDYVLQMVVDHEYRKPLLRALDESTKASEQLRERRLRSALEMLRCSTTRIRTIDEYIRDQADYKSTLDGIDQAFATAVTTPEKQSRPPLRQAQSTQEKLEMNESMRSCKELLRKLDVKLSDSDMADPIRLDHVLQSAITERSANLGRISSSATKAFHGNVDQSMASVEGDLLGLKAALYANSAYLTPHLTSQELQQRLEVVDDRIAEIGRGMASIDTGRLVNMARERQNAIFEANRA